MLKVQKRTKYRKYHRGRMRNLKQHGNEICFEPSFGLQALRQDWLSN
jgi:ribosomal protein L16/L10AE